MTRIRPRVTTKLRSKVGLSSGAQQSGRLPDLQPSFKLVRRIPWPGNHIFHTAFSPNGQLLLGGGDTGTLRIWEVATGNQLCELPVPVGLFTPDGKHVLGYKGDRTIALFDVTSGQRLRTWESSEAVVSLAIAPDGIQVVTSHPSNVLRLWDLQTGNLIRRLEGQVGVATLVYSPDSKAVLSFSSKDKTVRLWDVETGRLVRTFEDFRDATPIKGNDLIVQAFFLPGGRQIAGYVWGTDKTLLVWDAADGKVVRKLDLGVDHEKDLAISPDGRWFLTAHQGRTVASGVAKRHRRLRRSITPITSPSSVRLPDLATGKEIQRLETTDVNVPRAPNFSADGRFVVSGSDQSWVYLWKRQ